MFSFETSWRRLQDMSLRRIQEISSRRLEDVLQEVLKTSSRRLQDVFVGRLQDVLEDVKLLCWRRVEDVFKTSWRPTNVWWDITTPEFNKLIAEVFDARLGQVSLVTKTNFGTKLISLDQKINSNKTKHFLVENELKKLQKFFSIYFRGKRHFEEDGAQSYLVI